MNVFIRCAYDYDGIKKSSHKVKNAGNYRGDVGERSRVISLLLRTVTRARVI